MSKNEPAWVDRVLHALAERQAREHPGSIVEVIDRNTGEVTYSTAGHRRPDPPTTAQEHDEEPRT